MRDGLYNVLLLGHILAAIVGYGGVLLNRVYGAEARERDGLSAIAISDANLRATRVAQRFILAVPLLGSLLVLASDDVWEFSDFWILTAIVLYLTGIAIGHGVLTRSAERLSTLRRQAAASSTTATEAVHHETRILGRRLARYSMANRVILVAILYLMIWKPGL